MTKSTQSVTSRIRPTNPKAEAFSQQPHIRALIAEITFDVDDRVDQYIASAKRVRKLREEFEPQRKQLKMTWYEYAFHFLKVKDRNKLGLLGRIAEAKTKNEQEAIVRVFRNKQNNRAKISRDNKREEKRRAARSARRMSKWRKALLAWARKGAETEIQKAWLHVSRVFLTDHQRHQILQTISTARKPKRKRKKHD